MRKYIDICSPESADDLEGMIATARRLGWDGLCIAYPAKKRKAFEESAGDRGKKEELGICLSCTIISDNIRNRAPSARAFSDVVIADCRDREVLREVCERADVDVVIVGTRIDQVCARFLSKRKIFAAVDFSILLNSFGAKRVQNLSILRQNSRVLKKYGVPLIVISNAKNKYMLRSPRMFASLLKLLGSDDFRAVNSVSGFSMGLVEAAKDRKDPDVITEGVKIVR